MRGLKETQLMKKFLRKEGFKTPIHFNEARANGYRSIKVSTYGRRLTFVQIDKLRALFERNGFEVKKVKNTNLKAVECGTMYFAGPRVTYRKKGK